MATKLLNKGTRKAKLDGKKFREELNDQQQRFVYELVANDSYDYNAAAAKAGYANPAQAVRRLMHNPLIYQALCLAKHDRELRCKMTADEVLLYLKRVLFFNPLEYCRPGENGKWIIADLDKLPDWVGQMIEKMVLKTIEYVDGTTLSQYEVEFVSKTTALTLALKHTCVEQKDVAQSIDWDSLVQMAPDDSYDAVETRITLEEQKQLVHEKQANAVEP